MSELSFAVSVTGPIFLVVLLGFVLRVRGTIDAAFVHTASLLVFRFGLPALLFLSVYERGDGRAGDPRLIVFFVGTTALIAALGLVYARLARVPRGDVTVFVQGIFRGNLGIIGLAFCAKAYGPTGIAEAAVPMGVLTVVYNVAAVLMFGPTGNPGIGETRAGLLKSIVTNPLIVALAMGFAFREANLPLPAVLHETGNYFATLTLPLALLCIGASINFASLYALRGTVAAACVWKLVLSPLAFTALAWLLGWRGQSLGIVFFFSAAPTAAASYIMVKAVRGNESLAAAIVVFTTVLSVLTVTAGLVALKSLRLV